MADPSIDKFPVPSMDGPYDSFVTVVPHNSTNFVTLPRAIYVGTGGDVSLELNGGTALHKNVPSGSYIVARAKRVNSTGTTATDMLAVW